jgi:outer membrane protein assembly factor BamB
MFHGNPAHTGYVNAVGPSTNQTKWVYDTNGWVLTSPVIVNDVVYFTSSDAGYFGVSNNNIIAVKATDSTKIWNYSVGQRVNSYSDLKQEKERMMSLKAQYS